MTGDTLYSEHIKRIALQIKDYLKKALDAVKCIFCDHIAKDSNKTAMRRHIATHHRDTLSEKRNSSEADDPKPAKKPKKVVLGSSPKGDDKGDSFKNQQDPGMVARWL